ncbi:MAG: Sec-independent protein translocase subunit TatA/TatB [Actinomycetota bacterium]
MPGIGAPELIMIVGAIALLFGAKRLPEFARSLGKAKTEFRKGLNEAEPEAVETGKEAAAKPEQA